MNYRTRVAVFDCDSALLYSVDRDQAADLVGRGSSIHSMRGNLVSAIKLADGQLSQVSIAGFRPGSYGIRRELIAGHAVFDHRDTHEDEIQRAA